MDKKRCSWVNPNNPKYVTYHDEEWGVESHDDAYLFEMLVLECFQAGLAWETILNKRENFRSAFSDFNVDAVAAYDDDDIARLMNDASIIRNHRKIKAAINNARTFIDIQSEFTSFDDYIWSFTQGKSVDEAAAQELALGDIISKDLKHRGMSFVGPTVVYAYLQAIGLIHSHEEGCYLA